MRFKSILNHYIIKDVNEEQDKIIRDIRMFIGHIGEIKI